jgi:hypothetical protein
MRTRDPVLLMTIGAMELAGGLPPSADREQTLIKVIAALGLPPDSADETVRAAFDALFTEADDSEHPGDAVAPAADPEPPPAALAASSPRSALQWLANVARTGRTARERDDARILARAVKRDTAACGRKPARGPDPAIENTPAELEAAAQMSERSAKTFLRARAERRATQERRRDERLRGAR